MDFPKGTPIDVLDRNDQPLHLGDKVAVFDWVYGIGIEKTLIDPAKCYQYEVHEIKFRGGRFYIDSFDYANNLYNGYALLVETWNGNKLFDYKQNVGYPKIY